MPGAVWAPPSWPKRVVCKSRVLAHTRIQTDVRMHALTYVSTHIRTHAHSHTHTHTRTHPHAGGGAVYVAGGYGGGQIYHKSAERLDIGLGVFHRIADMHVPRTGLAVCTGMRMCVCERARARMCVCERPRETSKETERLCVCVCVCVCVFDPLHFRHEGGALARSHTHTHT